MRQTGFPASEAVPTQILLGSFSADRADPLHDLLRAARAGDTQAVAEVLQRVRSATPAEWLGIDDVVVVAVPAHAPGPTNGLVLALADALATARGWDHMRDALQRTRPAPEAKSGGARNAKAEATTLAWEPPAAGTAILLVDDVIRTGATLAACSMAIRASGDGRPVSAVVVAARGGGSVDV